MIVNLIANNPWLTPALLVIWQTLELYLGLKKPMDAGSIPQLLYRILQYLLTRKTKGFTQMATNPNARSIPVTVDGPTYDVLAIGVDIVRKALSGDKPQQIAQEELGAVMAQLGSLGQIAGDFALDRASIEAAVALQLQALVDAILAARLTKAAVTPAGAK